MAPSSTHDSVRSPELQKQIDEVQSRLRERIEAARPAHEANLRNASPSPNPNPASTAQKPKEKKMPARLGGPACPDAGRARPDAGTVSTTASDSTFERHRRKCQICRHPDREAIEAEFIDWGRVNSIKSAYQLRDDSVIYRHARATGLLALRRENLCMVVEKVLEEVDYVETPSAFAILRAVRTLACLNERGQWTEPPTTHVIVSATEPPVQSVNSTSSSSAPVASESSPAHSSIEPPDSSVQNSNRHTYEKLELDVSNSKQTTEVISNRHT